MQTRPWVTSNHCGLYARKVRQAQFRVLPERKIGQVGKTEKGTVVYLDSVGSRSLELEGLRDQ